MNWVKRKLAAFSRKFFTLASRQMLSHISKDIKANAVALEYLSQLTENYIPWTMPAMSPRSIGLLLNEIIINERSFIVELGSGISTLFIAKLISKTSTKKIFYSIEHDMAWRRKLEKMLLEEDAGSVVRFIDAPLVQSKYSMNNGTWYSSDALEAIPDQGIDFLIVDGPPSMESNLSTRYGALPFFNDKLAQDYALILDDACRKGEKRIISNWEDEFGVEFKIIGDVAYHVSGLSYLPYL